ncbi:MAG: type II toxin-antitoxin system Phd/YefM family antitoxin [Planctomycetota bacterium]|nr:type II toxin-antitoxin system Phd/YefM family antitoxin [Planctomycetota bacterium]
MKASVLDLRRRMKDILRALERNESVTLLYRGRPKGIIRPVGGTKARGKVRDDPAFGMWKDRKDMKDVDAFVRSLRKDRYRDL